MMQSSAPDLIIPRRIIQTCADKTAMLDEWAAGVATIRERNPDWEHELYDNDDVLDFIATHYGRDILEGFLRINPRYGAARADLFRYLAIYKLGGVYLDVKSSLDYPLDRILWPDDRFLVSQWRNRLGEEREGWGFLPELASVPGGEFQQWYIIAEAGSPYLARVIDQVLENIATYSIERFGVGRLGVLRTTGPIPYTLSVHPLLRQHHHRIIDAKVSVVRTFGTTRGVDQRSVGLISD